MNKQIIKYIFIFFILISSQSIASGKYITRHLTDNNETEDYTTIGISTLWYAGNGENNDVYVNTGVDGVNWKFQHLAGAFLIGLLTQLYRGIMLHLEPGKPVVPVIGTYLYNITSGVTTNLSGQVLITP